MSQIIIITYNFDAKLEMRPYRVRLHVRHVQKGVLKREHTHIGCVLMDGMCRTAMNRKPHPFFCPSTNFCYQFVSINLKKVGG